MTDEEITESIVPFVDEINLVGEIMEDMKQIGYGEIINKYDDDWTKISEQENLSEDFIREFESKVNWRSISIYTTLSEDFIREFESKVDWIWISESQELSEDFIREFSHKVGWWAIAIYQKLSPEFISEFREEFVTVGMPW